MTVESHRVVGLKVLPAAKRPSRARSSVLILSLALSLGVGPLAAETSPAEIIVLQAGRMMDGTGAAPIHPAMIRIERDRIAEVGTKVRVPPGARILDLGEAMLLPGLIDLHTHLTGDE